MQYVQNSYLPLAKSLMTATIMTTKELRYLIGMRILPWRPKRQGGGHLHCRAPSMPTMRWTRRHFQGRRWIHPELLDIHAF